MVDLDKSIAAFIRRLYKAKLTSDGVNAASTAASNIGNSFRNQSLATELQQLANRVFALRRQQSDANAISLIEGTLTRGWPISVELLYINILSNFVDPPLPELVKLAPTVKALSSLAKQFPSAKREIEAVALEQPETAAATAVADWWLRYGKLQQIGPLLVATLQTKTRRKGLASPETLLRSTLQRDKKGLLLQKLLAANSDTDFLIDRIAHAIVTAPKVASAYLPLLRTTKLQKAVAGGLVSLIRGVAKAAAVESGNVVALRTASLFLSGVVPDALLAVPGDHPMPHIAYEALESLHDVTNAASSDTARHSTWVVHSLASSHPKDNSALIGLEAAKVLRIAFDHAARGTDILALLESTAFNLGMRPFGEPGSRVQYNPMVHEDTVGGILPEDEALLMRKGWTLLDKTVVKALVRNL